MALTPIRYSDSRTTFGVPGAGQKLTTLNGVSPGATGQPRPYSLAAALAAPASPSRMLAGVGMVTDNNTQTPSVPVISAVPPVTPAAPSPPKPAPAAPTTGTVAPSLDADPVYQQIKALASMNDQQARNAAISGKTQLLENYGDPGIVNELGLGSNVAGIAAQNPNSTLAQLLMGHNQNDQNINQADNKANLYYSSTRAHHLADESRNYQQGRYNAEQNVRGQLGNIDMTLAQALAADRDQVTQGASDAYNRYLSTNPVAPTDTTTPPPPGGTDGGATNTTLALPGGATFLDANNPNVDRLGLALAAAARGRRNIGY